VREASHDQQQKSIKCEQCGKDGTVTVVADGFDDAPASFTIKKEYKGPCEPRYPPISAHEMHKLTGLPLAGWCETRY
jgi:hypothetical protein